MTTTLKKFSKSILLSSGMLFAFLLMSNDSFSQGKLERHVVQKHPDGTPYVVVHINPANGEIEKEEVFYPSGKHEWIGHYKGKKEHGKWTYFWPNGNVKSEEYYSRGKEDGPGIEYNEKGEKIKETLYKKGVVVAEKSAE